MDMSSIDSGIKMEKEGENFYKQNAENCTDPFAKQLLLILAYEENRHYQLMKSSREGLNGLMYTTFFKKVIYEFEQMTKSKQNLINNTSVLDILHKALEIEDKSIKLYAEQANNVHDSNLKNFFLGFMGYKTEIN